ncbi:MAG: tRNA (adenosine(37)-N6)-dimethylallyltransferase MiaA [Chloroflexi bacterium]|nr:tRNA (adenosine(37)-N6)-dimethylallyltransferase MiaA [Chloroflexota bacterium]
MERVVAIVGPTAVGKSRAALLIAKAFGGEIVNADSLQVYRYMDIGTAKPTPEEQRVIPHHVMDVVNPDESFSLALFQELAYGAIEDILRRGKLPLLVGGSGLYVWSVIEGWRIPRVPADPEFRRRMEEAVARQGTDWLYRQLQQLDPEAALRLDPRNVRRVIRALEVRQATGTLFSQHQTKQPPLFDCVMLGLTAEREDLYRRIDNRVDRMIEQGLVEEVRDLAMRGYGYDLPAMSSVGYRQIGQFLQGEEDLSAAVQQTKFETHRLARHQYAWFRSRDPRIRWHRMGEEDEEAVLPLVRKELARAE